MRQDNYGQMILTESDICDVYLQGRTIADCITDSDINFRDLEIENIPKIIKYIEQTDSVADFDKKNQQNWLMPDEYKNFDIAEWALSRCSTEEQIQRTGHELILYQDRNLFPLLRYLKYLVDTMRSNNIVWGVGRGSSVSSYVLYLIGIHKIDSIFYDLSIEEFLR